MHSSQIGATDFDTGQVVCSTTPTKVFDPSTLPQRPYIRSVFLYNMDATKTLYIGPLGTANSDNSNRPAVSTTNGFPIPAGTGLQIPAQCTVWGVSPTGTIQTAFISAKN